MNPASAAMDIMTDYYAILGVLITQKRSR